MATIDELIVRIKADTSSLEQGLKKAGVIAASSGKQIESGLGGALKSLRGEAGSLSSVLAGLAGVVGTQRIIAYTDTWRRLAGGLKLVTESSAELAAVQEELYDISIRSRSSFESVATLFQRLAFASNRGNTEVLEFTETVGKMLKVAGAGPQEASSAMLQLSQAIASGRLQGDEFRTLLEAMPPIMEALSKQLGVAKGKLKDLAAEGKISTDDLFKAVQGMAKTTEERFAKLPVTVGEAMTNLETSFMRFLGQSGAVSGTTATLAGGIQVLAGNMDLLGRAALALAAIFSARFVLAMAASITVMNPVLGAIYAIVGGMTLLATRTGEAGEAQRANTEQMKKALEIKGKLSTATGQAAQDLRQERDALLNTAKARLEGARAMLAEAKARQAAARPLSGYALAKVGLSPEQLASNDAVTDAEAAVGLAEQGLTGFQDIFTKEKPGGGGGGGGGSSAPKKLAEDYDAAGDAISDYITKLEQERELAGLSGKTLEERKAILEANAIALKQNTLLSPEMQEQIIREVDATYDLKEANEKLKKSQDEAAESAREWRQKLTDGLTDIVLHFDSASDAARRFFEEIAGQILRKKVTGPLSDSLSTAIGDSSLFSGIGKLLGFADGGSPPVGVPSIVGERGPELFVPKTAGTIIPNGQLGGQSIIIQNNWTFSSGVQRSDIEGILPVAVQASRNAIVSEIQKGGPLSQILRRN